MGIFIIFSSKDNNMSKFNELLPEILFPIFNNIISNINTVTALEKESLIHLLTLIILSNSDSFERDLQQIDFSPRGKAMLLSLYDLAHEHDRSAGNESLIQWVKQQYSARSDDDLLPKGAIKNHIQFYIKNYCEKLKHVNNAKWSAPLSKQAVDNAPHILNQENRQQDKEPTSGYRSHQEKSNIIPTRLDMIQQHHNQRFFNQTPLETASEYVWQGTLFYNKGHYEQALTSYKKALLLATDATELADIRQRQSVTEHALQWQKNPAQSLLTKTSLAANNPIKPTANHNTKASFFTSPNFDTTNTPRKSNQISADSSVATEHFSAILNQIKIFSQQAAQCLHYHDYHSALNFNAQALNLHLQYFQSEQSELLVQRIAILKVLQQEDTKKVQLRTAM
jgi:hypothetical protein